jgi:hypothetical protein
MRPPVAAAAATEEEAKWAAYNEHPSHNSIAKVQLQCRAVPAVHNGDEHEANYGQN